VRLEGEEAGRALVEAARESERAPFISSIDAKSWPLQEQETQPPPPATRLSEVEF